MAIFLGRAFAWLLFLIAQWGWIGLAVLPPNSKWSFYNIHSHLLPLLGASVVAYWVFEPQMRGGPNSKLTQRLFVGAAVLFCTLFLVLGTWEIVQNARCAKP
jgi:hypothetical protein